MFLPSLPVLTAVAADEVIYTNSFESGEETWQLTNNNGTIMAGEDSAAKSGSRSYSFQARSAVTDSAENKEITKTFDVEYGKYYRADISYLLDGYQRRNGTDGGAYISYELTGDTGTLEEYRYCIASEKTESGEWKDLSFYITPTKKAKQVKIKLGFAAAVGKVSFDDFTFSSIDKKEVGINPVSPKQASGDVAESYSTGFEDSDTDYWKYGAQSGDAEVGVTTDIAHSGSKSFKFYSVSQNRDPSNNTYIVNNKSGQMMFVLEPGVYQISFWYYLKDYKRFNNTHGASLAVSAYNGGTELRGSGYTKTFDVKEDTGGEWRQYTFTTTLSEECDRLRMNIGFRCSTGTYAVDDIEVTPVLTGLVTTPDKEHYNGVTVKKDGDDAVSVDIDYEQAVSPAILDTIIIGNEESEKAHSFEAPNSITGYGGLGDTYRQLYPQEEATFEIAVDPEKMNYLTVKLWGSEFPQNDQRQHLAVTDEYGTFSQEYGTNWPDLDSMMHEQAQNGSYYYATIRIPPQATMGRTKIKLKLFNRGNYNTYGATKYAETKEYSRSIFKIATHTEAEYIPQADDKSAATKRYDLTKIYVSPNGLSPYDYMINKLDSGVESMMSRQNYGPEWEKNVADGLSPAGATGAYMEGTNSLRHGTWENWCKNVYYNRCVGSNSENMKGMRVLALAYDSEWSKYYHDPELVDRCVSWLDFMVRAQASNGGFNDAVNVAWCGAPNRGISTNAINSGERVMGEVFLMLHEEMEEMGYLDQTIDDDLNPDTPEINRAKAYENMFYNMSYYMFEYISRRTAVNQDLFNIISGTAAEQCLKILNPSRCRSISDLHYLWYTSTGLAVAPWDSIQISPKGLSMETHGHLNGAYDGNYGMHGASMAADLALMTNDKNIMDKAVRAANALTYFQEIITDSQGYVAVRKEDAINTRNTYTPGRVEYTAWNNFNAIQCGSKDALRELELYIQYGEVYRADLTTDSRDLFYIMQAFDYMADKIKKASEGYKTFADISGIDEEGSIVTLAWKGIIDGVTDLTFKPDDRIDKETFERWLSNAFGNTTEIPYSILYTRAQAAQLILEKLYANGVDIGRFDLGSGIYLPNEPWVHKDYVFDDAIAESYAWKLHDNEIFRCTMNWRSEYSSSTERSRAVATTSEVLRYHVMKDEYSSVGCAYMTAPLGLRRVDIAKYGKYIIISNVSDENKSVNIEFGADIKKARDIVSGDMIDVNSDISLPAQKTIVLNLEDVEK